MSGSPLNLGNVGTLGNIKLYENMHWPDSAPFGVCLTHDVDRVKKTYQYLTHSIKNRSLKPLLGILRRKAEPYWQFDNIMQIEREREVRSTFFFLNESFRFNPLRPSTWPMSLGRYNIKSKKIKTIIRRLNQGGWEIGMHGSIRSYADGAMLAREKATLESIVDHGINGIRQHWLNLEIPDTWVRQANVGFRYDRTFSDRYVVGFKEGIHHPFSPENLDNFIVFPLSIMDTFLFGQCSKFDDAWDAVVGVIDTVERSHGVLCVLWHQMVFFEQDFPLYVEIYKKLIEECKGRGAWFGTCQQVYDLIMTNN